MTSGSCWRRSTSLGAIVAAAAALGAPAMVLAGTNTTSLSHSVVLSDLELPWDLAFLDDETMFFTEKCQGLSVLMPSGEVNALLGMTGTDGYASTADDLFCEGQAGMMGVAVDPAFAENRRIYVYSTSNMSDPHTNRLMRFVVSDDFTDVSDRADIVDDVPYKMASSDHPFGGPGAHNGGRVRWGPDGYLYLTTGDNHNAEIPQSPILMGSKVLRIDADGNAAPDNAPPDGFDFRIYTYGHRNVQGIAFRPGTGQAFSAEHGPNHSDEVTPLVAGGNGGWDPQLRPALSCPDSYCGYAGNPTTMPMTDLTRFPAALAPAWNNNSSSQGTGPATFLVGSQWRAWNGRLAVGIMAAQRLVILELNGAGVSTGSLNASVPGARFRALTQGPDGALYVATDAGEIWRVTPSPGIGAVRE